MTEPNHQNLSPVQGNDPYYKAYESPAEEKGFPQATSAPPVRSGSYYRLPLTQPGSKSDMIFAGIFLLLSLLCVNFSFYGGFGLPLSLSAICMYLCGVAYLYPKRRHCKSYAFSCMLLYILCALSLSISGDTSAKLLNVGAMMVLSSLTVMEIMDLRRNPKGSLRAVLDWFLCFLVKPFEGLSELSFALFHKENAEGQSENRKIGPVLIGLGCALPVLLLVIPLLTSADEAFRNLLKKIIGDGSSELIVTLLFGVALFFLYFAQHFTAKHREKDASVPAPAHRPLDTVLLASFLGAICLIYVLYLLSQFAYFFNAFAGLLPKNFTFAEYARQGFFEMVAVCLINLLILFLSLMKARKDRGKQGDKEPVILRIFSIFLCLFSLVLIATAMSKMVLYIRHYGMTHLRLTTSVFMIFLTVVFCTMLRWIFLRKIPYMKVAVITAALLIAALGFANPSRVVAKYNVEAYLSGKLESIDMDTLAMLNRDSAVPYLWMLFDDPDATVKAEARRLLFFALKEHNLVEFKAGYYTPSDTDFPLKRFNFCSYKSYLLLKEHRQAIGEAHSVPYRES